MARIKIQDVEIMQGAARTSHIQWMHRHNEAIDHPRGFEIPIVRMLHFWEMYAAEHQERFESKIGEDYVLGPEWRDIGLAIRGLLNGETGRLDCGTLDAFILNTLKEEGIETENL